jgi:hypothetical protein
MGGDVAWKPLKMNLLCQFGDNSAQFIEQLFNRKWLIGDLLVI